MVLDSRQWRCHAVTLKRSQSPSPGKRRGWLCMGSQGGWSRQVQELHLEGGSERWRCGSAFGSNSCFKRRDERWRLGCRKCNAWLFHWQLYSFSKFNSITPISLDASTAFRPRALWGMGYYSKIIPRQWCSLSVCKTVKRIWTLWLGTGSGWADVTVLSSEKDLAPSQRCHRSVKFPKTRYWILNYN